MRLSLALILLTSPVVANYAQEDSDRNLRRVAFTIYKANGYKANDL
jgi:hypothetical protein